MTNAALIADRASQPAVSSSTTPIWLPWEALTRPSMAFAALAERPAWLPGLLAQYLLLLAGAIVAAPGNNDLIVVFKGVTARDPLSLVSVLGIIGGIALLTVALNAGFAGLLFLAFRLLGFFRSFPRLLALVSVSLVPLALGQALGQLLFALAMPLSRDPADVLALQFHPYSAGLATWLGHPPASLSLQWALLSGFDLFAVWALSLGWIGIRRMLDAPRTLALWLQVILLLVYGASVIGLWQAAQAWLAAVKSG